MKQNRFRSKAAWLAVIAQLGLIVALFASAEQLNAFILIAGAVVEIATVLGIFNDPTNPSGF